MDKNRDPENIRQKISLELEQWIESFGLPPTPFVRNVLEIAIFGPLARKKSRKQISVASLFVGLVEAGKNQGLMTQGREEMSCSVFSNILLEKMNWVYPMFIEDILSGRGDYSDESLFVKSSSNLEITKEAKELINRASSLGKNIFNSKYLKGQHIALGLFNPDFNRFSWQIFTRAKMKKEKFLYEWVKALKLNLEEFVDWDKAFRVMGCIVDVSEIYQEREKEIAQGKEYEEALDPSIKERQSLGIDGKLEPEEGHTPNSSVLKKDIFEGKEEFIEEGELSVNISGFPAIIRKMVEKFEPPASNLILEIFRTAILITPQKKLNIDVLTSFSIFVSLIEFSKHKSFNLRKTEVRNCRKFIHIFLDLFEKKYNKYLSDYVEEVDLSREPFPKKILISEVSKNVEGFFNTAQILAKNIFRTKYLQGEHLILSLLGSRITPTALRLDDMGLNRADLLLPWIKSMDLSIGDLNHWRRALEFLNCNVDIEEIIKEKSNKGLIEDLRPLIDESVDESSSVAVDDDDMPIETVEAEVENTLPEVEEIAQEIEEEAPVNLYIAKEELGRAYARGDQPGSKVEDDLLGRDHTVEALAEMIADEKQGTPFTIGLLGNWGAGKSTVMKMLHDVLRKRKDGSRFEFAEFNAWEYERTANLEAGLAQEVIRGLVDRLTTKEKRRIKVEFALKEYGAKAKILFSTIGLIVSFLLFGFIEVVYHFNIWIITHFHESYIWKISHLYEALNLYGWGKEIFGGGVALLAGCWGLFRKLSEHPLSVELNTYLKLPDYGKHLGLIPVLKKHITFLCKIRLGTAAERNKVRKEKLGFWGSILFKNELEDESMLSRRLVVFIDDLDRCDPDSITKTLDAVRLVMDVENVMVVIGVDHRIALRAVGDHYKKLADEQHSSKDIARDYLGKILQLVIILNRPTDDELKKFVREGLFPEAVEIKKDSGVVEHEAEKDFEEAVKELLDDKVNPIVEADEQDLKTTISLDNPLGEVGSLNENLIDKENETFEEETEENLWRKEIEFSTNERELFAELAIIFELRNPRQLLRLRNSYGLLKLLYGMQNSIPYMPYYKKESASEEGKVQLMILLFWKEFEAAHLKWGQQVKEYLAGKLDTTETPVDPIVLIIANRMSEADIGGLKFSFTGLTATADFVERFVLPRSDGLDGKSGSQPAG
jgi:hypothetical protein